MKIRPVEAKLFHGDGQTERHTEGQADITKLTVALCYFANTPTTDSQTAGNDTWFQTSTQRTFQVRQSRIKAFYVCREDFTRRDFNERNTALFLRCDECLHLN